MTPWIQVYANLPSHRKVCKLRTALGAKSNYEATGLIVCLWCWAAVNATDGNLTGYSSKDIAEAVGCKKAPGQLLDTLIDAGFVDKLEDGRIVIHDWEEHASLLMDSNEQQKKNTRERVRKYRERRKGNVTCNVTGNECNTPTLPNLTLPNQTIDFSGSSSSCAGAVSQRIEELAVGLFWLYVGRKPTQNDVERVQNRILFKGEINANAYGLLEYAFEASSKAGVGGNWNYIEAVLDRCNLQNIFTASEARLADMERGEYE